MNGDGICHPLNPIWATAYQVTPVLVPACPSVDTSPSLIFLPYGPFTDPQPRSVCLGVGRALQSHVYAFCTQAKLSAQGLGHLPLCLGPWVVDAGSELLQEVELSS